MAKMADIYKKKQETRPFHLVFLDVRMPGLDGVETCRAIREIDPRIIIIMISAYAVEKEVEEAQRLGALDFLSKPFDVKRIFSIVESVRNRKKTRRLRILVVDDETYTRNFLYELLKESCEVVTAEEGSEALEVLKGTLVIERRGEVEREALSFREGVARQVKEKEEREKLSQALYDKGIVTIKKVLKEAEEGNIESGHEVNKVVEEMVDFLSSGDDSLVILANKRATEENYLYAHSVNVSILSIKVGLGLDYERDRLIDLGVAAFLHDVGMVRVMEIARLPRKLTKKEYEEIKKHPKYGKEILEKMREISKLAVETAYQQHERLKGQGYPQGLRDCKINGDAQIVGLVDVYEALTHPRVYRERFPPHEAMRMIVDSSKDLFSLRMIKELMRELGTYPIGSIARLNSREVGRVIGVNKRFPLRPRILILFDREGQKLSEPREVDLVKSGLLHIVEPIDEDKLESELGRSDWWINLWRNAG